MALPQPHRLRRWQDFREVYRKGIRRSGRFLTLRGLRHSPEVEKSATQIGISISQKVSKKAVVRNRVKRQIRAALRHLLPRLTPGWQLVVVVRPGAQKCDYAQFLRELEQLLAEAEVIDGH